ncbi:MAG: phosphatidylglycerophosphatase A, partial [Opitutales bacterium]|nr:phosphatidylglycerophosphatase A [Opitutales bacterium]
SFAGIFWYLLGFWHISFGQFLLAFGISVAIGTCFCGEAEVRIGEKDPSCVILDEFLAMPLCYWNCEKFAEYLEPWKLILWGFILFRVFDIWKPCGIRSLQKMRGGAGIMLDDIAAAFATCLVIHIAAPLLAH